MMIGEGDQSEKCKRILAWICKRSQRTVLGRQVRKWRNWREKKGFKYIQIFQDFPNIVMLKICLALHFCPMSILQGISMESCQQKWEIQEYLVIFHILKQRRECGIFQKTFGKESAFYREIQAVIFFPQTTYNWIRYGSGKCSYFHLIHLIAGFDSQKLQNRYFPVMSAFMTIV